MSRNVPAALAAHLKQPATTVCYLLKIMPKRPGVPVFGLTTLDADRTYDDGTGALTYRAKRGYTAFDLDTKADLSVDSSEAAGLLAEYPADGVTAEGIARGDYDGARFVQYLVNYEDLTMGHVILNAGQVGQIKMIDDLTCKIELRSLTQILKQNSIIELTSITCRAQFGDNRCKMPLRPYPATVATVGPETDRSFTVVNTSGNLVIPASAEKFLTAVGGEVGAVLAYGGLPLEGTPTVTAIHRTDWQGRQLLYATARTNRCLRSQSFTASPWISSASGTGVPPTVTDNYATAPDGTATAARIQASRSTTSDQSRISQSIACTVGDSIRQRIWMKSNTGANQLINFAISGVARIDFTATNAWQEVDTNWIATTTNAAPYIGLFGPSGLACDVLIWGCGQDANSANPSMGAYIPTTTAPVTVTDYTLTGPSVALGQAATAGAVYDWDGSVSLPTTDGLFVPGVVHWLTGANAGRENEVESYVAATGTVTLVIPTYQTIAPGDTFTIRRDCDKSKAMCKAYGNLLNMRAEPELPRADGTSLQSPTQSS